MVVKAQLIESRSLRLTPVNAEVLDWEQTGG